MTDDIEGVVRVHKACLDAVTEPARAVLDAYRAQVGVANGPDDKVVTLQVSIKVGTLRNLAAHLAHGH